MILAKILVVIVLLGISANAQLPLKPLPGTRINVGNTITPLNYGSSSNTGGLILPYDEGSGTPVATLWTGSERLGAITGAVWSSGGGTSKWGGPVMSHITTSDAINLGVNTDFINLNETTIVLACRKRDTTTRNSALFCVDTANTTFFVEVLTLEVTDGKVYWRFGGVVEGTSQLSVGGLALQADNLWVFNVGPRGMEIWLNGSLVGSQTGHLARVGNAQNFIIGNTANRGPSDLMDYAFLYIYPSQLSQPDCQWISANPFCFYDWGEDQFKGVAHVRTRGDFFSPFIPPELNLLNRLQLPRYLK